VQKQTQNRINFEIFFLFFFRFFPNNTNLKKLRIVNRKIQFIGPKRFRLRCAIESND